MGSSRDEFIRALAIFFTKDQMRMHIEIEMKRPCAIAWAVLRSYTPLSGWPTYREAEEQLREFLDGKEPSATVSGTIGPAGPQTKKTIK